MKMKLRTHRMAMKIMKEEIKNMLIHEDKDKQQEHVKFISYDGAYPNLCSGILELEIDGDRYAFGDLWHSDGRKLYPSFWATGGNCGFRNAYSDSYVNTGEWEIYVSNLPESIRKYAAEIDEVFNANVSWGCCGGCL